ncbi:AraC family transcriptional regulator [Desulfosporosinus fructosivorans]|uniref:AraC family transcriptional regulator n=1 Tax=Desulfosporosinus fructosivorans TaxID=2018669 RepID=A0A4Z0R5Y5_9FIRM|nr:GyrI-like domain-containing protein [Desulfosporosinus fructosivorans]TGE38442.1 AraC family transcriptional regulator [Desulfosporosinus fructosivorans]
MDYEVVSLKEKTVVGLMVNTTNEDNKAMMDIGMLWGQFLQEGVYDAIFDKINAKGIGLYTDYQGDFTKPYKFVACCEVSDAKRIASKMVVKKILQGNYAKFIIKGHMQRAVSEFWSNLWGLTLDRKYSTDFEEYQNDSDDMEKQEIHIYIGLNH